MTRIHEGFRILALYRLTAWKRWKSAENQASFRFQRVQLRSERRRTYTEYFAKGTAPTETCDCHVRVSVCGVSGGRPTASVRKTSLYPKPLWQFPTRLYR